MISSFVLVIMLILEFINIQSQGRWLGKLSNKKWGQYFFAAGLGLVPGCVGTFGIVSMYMHNFISFGALVTALSVTFGDEAFVMFALIPSTALKIVIIITIIGIITGILVDYFFKNVKFKTASKAHFEIHHHDVHGSFFDFRQLVYNVKQISFQRAALAGGVLLIILGIISGEFGHNHAAHSIEVHNDHGPDCDHAVDSGFAFAQVWGWEQISFLIIMLVGLFIILRANEHFLEAHFWKHIIKKHFLKIFLWTFGALLFIEIFNTYLHWDEWISENQLIILLLAVAIGIIPESGPHLIFVTLFFNGAIPFSTLLASSIVQDGHGALPLFAESKKSFFMAKAINIFVGLLVGLLGLYFFK